jgi:hypothetical protein
MRRIAQLFRATTKNTFFIYNYRLFLFIFSLCFVDETTLKIADGENAATAKQEKEKEKPLIVRSVDKEKGLPKETQMAQCTITSGDIKASAQATFSKKLEGFCSTSWS